MYLFMNVLWNTVGVFGEKRKLGDTSMSKSHVPKFSINHLSKLDAVNAGGRTREVVQLTMV
jgi:hypothetical protein